MRPDRANFVTLATNPPDRPAAGAPCAPTLRLVQTVLDVSNEVAAELAGIGDGDARRAARPARLHRQPARKPPHARPATTLKVAEAQAVVEELVELVEGGQEVGAGTVDAILGAIDQAEDVREIFEDVVWSHRGKQDHAEDRDAEALRRRDPRLHRHLRDRPRRAPARPTSRSRSRSRRSRSGRSAGSSSRAPPSRRASGSASSRATSSRRSTRTCARSSTRSTTRWIRRSSTRTWSAARSRSRRSRSCAAARSTTASSSSTRRRTPRPSRCRCSSRGSASARRWS